jgi:hypothetical protein
MVRSHCRFGKISTDYLSEPGMKWMRQHEARARPSPKVTSA